MENGDDAAIADISPGAVNEGNLALAVLLGVAAAAVGAGIWAGITVLTGYQIGWMAVGVGFLVGMAVRFGKGTQVGYRVLGAILALTGCLAGNLFTVVLAGAKETQLPVLEVFQLLPFNTLIEILAENFEIVDLLFYALALYEGWKFAVAGPAKAD